jgi:protein-L-isoaspartate(D-aspartate) O-methyltransferase
LIPNVSEREGFAKLVLRLRAAGISDINLLTAVEQTPRSMFAPPEFRESAWSSRTIPIDCGGFMEGVDLAVQIIHALNIQPGNRILEIGTGSGYTAAVMGRLAERVHTVDRYNTLVTAAASRMERLQLRNVIVRKADGSVGMIGETTYDRILITGAFTTIPRTFQEQLVSGGAMLVPLMLNENHCKLVRLTKVGSRFERTDLFDVPYLPLIPHMASAL